LYIIPSWPILLLLLGQDDNRVGGCINTHSADLTRPGAGGACRHGRLTAGQGCSPCGCFSPFRWVSSVLLRFVWLSIYIYIIGTPTTLNITLILNLKKIYIFIKYILQSIKFLFRGFCFAILLLSHKQCNLIRINNNVVKFQCHNNFNAFLSLFDISVFSLSLIWILKLNSAACFRNILELVGTENNYLLQWNEFNLLWIKSPYSLPKFQFG